MERWEILASATALLWAFFKTTAFFEMRRNAHIQRVYEALEIGVQIAWNHVIKPYLAKNGGGDKLPPIIRAEAERVAIEAAEAADSIIARTPRDTLIATLKMAVEEAKRRGGK